MKKKVLILGGVALVVVVILIVFLLPKKENYTIVVSMVDARSPDRILTVYDSNNQKVQIKKIMYLDGTLLCNGYNPTVHYSDVENEKEVKIVLKDNSEIVARIAKEEVENEK